MNKLQKSLVAATALKENHALEKMDIKIKVAEPKGMNATLYESVLGKILKFDKYQDEPIFETDFIS
jgi:sialic acid synthase SpsE